MEKRTILIADDKKNCRHSLKNILINNGFNIIGETATGKEAVELNAQLHPDLIVLDLDVSECGDIETVREMNSYHFVPIILLTAKSGLDTLSMAKTTGVMACLLKPFHENELLVTIEIAIARFEQFAAIKKENTELRQKIEARKSIERAKGILMKQQRIEEPEAFRKIQQLSMNRHIPMKDIAQSIIITAEM